MEKEAQNDLKNDFEELLYLYGSYSKNLHIFQKSLSKISNFPSYKFIKDQTEYYLRYLQNTTDEIKDSLKKIKSINNEQDIIYLSKKKEIFFNNLRTRISIIAGLITSTDWQSPSYAHSINSQAGIQEGKITANINDYKRDRHLNEIDYQNKFIKEYIDGLVKFPIKAYLTTSGMAALTSILTFLIINQRISGPVIIGKSIYFENTTMIKNFFKEKKVLEVDEIKTDTILDTYDKQKPDVLIFDSLCNANTIAVPNLLKILKHIAKHATKEIYFIIDNSTLSVALQPLKEVVLKTHIRLIVFESLNKYHQYGLDRVTAGIIWVWGLGFADFNFARVHSGTNIIDSSCYVLPLPNRKFLQKRLLRFNRNATFIASSILDYVTTYPTNKISTVIYPGLENHPSFSWSKNYFFHGSYFVIVFQKKYQKVNEYQRFVKMIIQTAKKKKVSINGGTSFGFNTTRIYLTAKDNKFGTPFVRVSVGTENILELEKIKDVFLQTIKSF